MMSAFEQMERKKVELLGISFRGRLVARIKMKHNGGTANVERCTDKVAAAKGRGGLVECRGGMVDILDQRCERLRDTGNSQSGFVGGDGWRKRMDKESQEIITQHCVFGQA